MGGIGIPGTITVSSYLNQTKSLYLRLIAIFKAGISMVYVTKDRSKTPPSCFSNLVIFIFKSISLILFGYFVKHLKLAI